MKFPAAEKMYKKVGFVKAILILAIVVLLKTATVYAVCAECPDGWAPCGTNQCCYGGSCPSFACGECPAPNQYVWRPEASKEPGGGFSICETPSGVALWSCAAACLGCGTDPSGGAKPKADYYGTIYEDINNNNLFDNGIDYAYGPPGWACTGPKVKIKPGLTHYTRYKIDKDWVYDYATWWCDSDGNPSFFGGAGGYDLTTTQMWVNNTGVSSCTQLTWRGQISKATWEEGTFIADCSMFIYPKEATKLQLFVRVPPEGPFPRQVSGRLHEVTNPATCTVTGNLELPNLRTQLYNNILTVGSAANVDSATGNYAITDVDSYSIFNRLGVLGSLSRVDRAYKLACVRPSAGTTCNLGTGAVVNCSPSDMLAANDASIRLGFTRILNEKWFATIDGDFFADDVSTYVSAAPSGNFAPYIANTFNATSVGAYGFANNSIETRTASSDVSEKGGAAQDLGADPERTFNDKWLESFSFNPPADAETKVPGNKNFAEGKIYALTVEDFNDIVAGGNYKVVAANAGDIATAVVYVTGTDPIIIDNEFVADDPEKQVIIVVTNTDVEISSDLYWSDATSFNLTTPSQLDLAIISAKDININSRYDAATNTADNPIKINGTLMAKGGIGFNRDLGNLNNSLIPAETISYYPHLLNLIQKYELENTDTINYTGLTTYDVQYVYKD